MPVAADSFEAKRKLLEKYLRGELPQISSQPERITQRPSEERVPLSLAQEQLWIRAQSTNRLLYNESITIRIQGPLEAAILQSSITEIVRRHEIWRTTLQVIAGQPAQMIHPAPSALPLPVVDLREMSPPEQEAALAQLTQQQARAPFDLQQGPLLRTMLVKISASEHRLYLFAHLSIVDGVSVYQVFPSELKTLYQAFSAGGPSPLPKLPIQYGDFAYWQRQRFEREERDRGLAYWRGQLAGDIRVLRWPNDRPRPARQTFRGKIRPFSLQESLTGALKGASYKQGVTLFMLLLAGLTALLYRYTGQDDFILGTLSPAGRKRSEVQKMLGHFLNPVPLRFKLSPSLTFRDLLRQAQSVLTGAISHDELPLDLLARELQLQSDPSRNPFFTIAISLQPPMPDLGPGWSVTSMDAESGGAMWDLYIAFIDGNKSLMGRAQYNPDLFEPATITRTLQDLQVVLSAATANPEQRLSNLPLPAATTGVTGG